MFTWISPHKFNRDAIQSSKKKKKQQKEQQRQQQQQQHQLSDAALDAAAETFQPEDVLFDDDDNDRDHDDVDNDAQTQQHQQQHVSRYSHLEKWFDMKPQDSTLRAAMMDESENKQQKHERPSLQLIEEMLRVAVAVFNKKNNNKNNYGSSFSLEDELIRKGTSSDRIATMALLVAKDPMHNVKRLDQLLKMCMGSNGRAADLAIRTLKDLLLGNLLPTSPANNSGALFEMKMYKDQNLQDLYDAVHREQQQQKKNSNTDANAAAAAAEEEEDKKKKQQVRKHITFAGKKGATTATVTEERITTVEKIDEEKLLPLHEKFFCYWYFEDLLKKRFIQFIDVLVERTKSTNNELQIKAVLDLRDLLRGTHTDSVERSTIVRAVINKLHAKEVKVASSTMKFLLSLLNPVLSSGGASSTEEGDASNGVQYNRFYIKDFDRKFFVQEVAQIVYSVNVETEQKLYAATLLNRIELMEKVDRELARDLINIYLKALVIHFKKNDSDSSTMRALLTGLHRAVRCAEIGSEAFQEQLETILIIARKSQFNNAVEALRVVWYLMESSRDPKLVSRFMTILYDKLLDDGIRTHSTKTAGFLSLLFKAMKKDLDSKRQRAFCKRILQSALVGSTEYACSCILLLKNFVAFLPHLRAMYMEPEAKLRMDNMIDSDNVVGSASRASSGNGDGDDDQIMFAKSNDNDNGEESDANTALQQQQQQQNTTTDVVYDPTCPAPQRSRAELAALYEILPFTKFYHPSGLLFANNTVKNKKISRYEGNPLDDFNVIAFLDKFMYRKARSSKKLNPLNARHGALGEGASLDAQIEALNSAGAWGEEDGANEEATGSTKSNRALPRETVLPPESLVRPDEMFKLKFLQKKQAVIADATANQRKRMETALQYRQSIIEMNDREIDRQLRDVVSDDENDDKDSATDGAIDGEDDDDDNLSVYSYSQLDKVLQEDQLSEGEVEQLLMEYESDMDEEDSDDEDDDMDEDEEEGKSGKKKRKTQFGYDVTNVSSENPDQSEIAELLEQGEDDLIKEAKREARLEASEFLNAKQQRGDDGAPRSSKKKGGKGGKPNSVAGHKRKRSGAPPPQGNKKQGGHRKGKK